MQVKMFNYSTWKPNCPIGEIPNRELHKVSLDRYGKDLFIKAPESQAEKSGGVSTKEMRSMTKEKKKKKITRQFGED